MELRQLCYFLAVAETLHFRRAAERLHIAEQSLSTQIKKLETELGFPLFERTTRQVALTEAGRVFKADAARILRELDSSVAKAADVAAGQEGVIALTYDTSVVYSVLPVFIREFRRRNPRVKLILTERASPDYDSFAKREGDVYLTSLYQPLPHGLAHEKIAREVGVIAMPCGHPLARFDALHMEQLRGVPFISYAADTNPIAAESAVADAHQAGFELNVVQEVRGVFSMLALVAAGMGVGLAAESSCRIYGGAIEHRPLLAQSGELRQATAHISLLWRTRDKTPLVDAAISCARLCCTVLEKEERQRRAAGGRDAGTCPD